MRSLSIDYYKETGQKLNNTPAQYKEEFPWLKEVDSFTQPTFGSFTLWPSIRTEPFWLFVEYEARQFFFDLKRGLPKCLLSFQK